jgi:hypothetical protein
MANTATSRDRGVAQVDFLIDENGSRIDVPDDSTLKVATDADETVGAAGPTNWWRLGIAVLAVIVLGLLIMQFVGGGPPATDVVPGTPVTAPINQPIATN